MNKKIFGLLVAMYAMIFALPMTASAEETIFSSDAAVIDAVKAVALNEEDFVMYETVETLEQSVNVLEPVYAPESGVQVKWDGYLHDNTMGYIIFRYEYDFMAGKADEESCQYWIVDASQPWEFYDTTTEAGNLYIYTIVGLIGDGKAITHITTVGDEAISSSVLTIEKPEIEIVNQVKGIKVTWDKIEGADGYLVYRKNVGTEWSEKPYKVIENPDKTSFINTAITNGQGYYYMVTAYKADPTDAEYIWETEAGTERYIRRLARPVVTVKNEAKSIKVSWPKVAGANSYEIYRGGNLVKKTKNTFWYDKNKTNGFRYRYSVKAIYTGGSGTKYQGAKSLDKVICRLMRPSINNLKGGKRRFVVKYGRNKKATGYQIRYSTKKNFNVSRFVNTTGTIKTVPKLRKGTTYYVKVRSYKTINGVRHYSQYSPVRRIRVK